MSSREIVGNTPRESYLGALLSPLLFDRLTDASLAAQMLRLLALIACLACAAAGPIPQPDAIVAAAAAQHTPDASHIVHPLAQAASDAHATVTDTAEKMMSSFVDTRSESEECPGFFAAIGDLLGVVPTFLTAHGGFEAALAKAVAELDSCTLEALNSLVFALGDSPLGSLCR